MTLLEKALQFAMTKHKGQLRDDGKTPYINHPKKVFETLRVVKPMDKELLAAGLLHDTLEDTQTSYEELRKVFGTRIADLVSEVTREGKKDAHGYRFPRLKTRDGYLIKFADRLSNLSEMDAWDEKKQKHYMKTSIFWRTR